MTRSVVALAVMVLLGSTAACGDSGATLSPTMTAAPPVTAPPSASAGPSSSGGEPSPADEPVDLVVMALSGGWGVSERYAPLLTAALGRDVRTHGKIDALPTEVLGGPWPYWADTVAGAEVILFYFPPAGYEPPGFLPCLEALDAEDGGTWDPPEATTVEDWRAWRDALDREYEAMWALREGQPTIIRGYGGWNPWIPVWRRLGIEAECSAGEVALDQVMRDSAEAAGAVYVSMLDVFTGSEQDQDPPEQGWIDTDGMHLSDAGKDVLVEALAAAGFEVNEPPR